MKATVKMALITMLMGLCALHAQKLPKKTSIDISKTQKNRLKHQDHCQAPKNRS